MNIYNLATMPSQHSKASWFNLDTNKIGKHVDIYLYGVIGGYNVNVQQFLYELQVAGDVDTITVYINSVGGSFYDGLAIANTLKQHKAQVTTRVMGYALSMASVIMLAGDVVEAAENALIMIHRAFGSLDLGDADDFKKQADILAKHEALLIQSYTQRMNLQEKDVFKLLKAETWYTAGEAKQAGLIDNLLGDVVLDPKTVALDGEAVNYALRNCRNIPANVRQGLPVNQSSKPIQASVEDGEFVSKRKYDMLNDDFEFLRQRHEDIKGNYEGLKERAEKAEAFIEEMSKPQPGTVPPPFPGFASKPDGWFGR